MSAEGTTQAPASTTEAAEPTTAIPQPLDDIMSYVIPVSDSSLAGWGDTHSGYPATDIFADGCGGALVAPVDGTLLEVRRVDSYDPVVDHPATRGGRSIAILGDDGVRYYLAHLDLIAEELAVGERIDAGRSVGTIGSTGRSSACHVHFGISPPCPMPEWSVRRGVVWPYPYLNSWRDGGRLSPDDEVQQWLADNPNGCADAANQ